MNCSETGSTVITSEEKQPASQASGVSFYIIIVVKNRHDISESWWVYANRNSESDVEIEI